MMWIVPPASFPQTTNKPNNPRDVLVNAIVTEWEETGWSLEVSKGEVGTVITACQNDVCCAARLQECGVEPKPDACVDTRAGVGSVYVHVWKIQ